MKTPPLFLPPLRAARAALLLPLAVLAGCAAPPPERTQAAAGYCAPPLPYRYNPAYLPAADADAALTPELLARYPRRNLLTANAVGILPALRKAASLSAPGAGDAGLARELALLKQRQAILAQVTLVMSAVGSLAAELDCEGERADQMAGYLARLDNERTQRLNVLSIVVGALSGIGTTVGDGRGTQYAFGVGGGLLAAGLGILTLTQDGTTHDFRHPRNLLADVWTGEPASAAWPPSVWRMLTDPAFSNQGRTSIAHNTRERWRRHGQLAQPDSERGHALTALLFGTGGAYSADRLKLRADMLNEMQSSVRLLNQELQGLLLVLTEEWADGADAPEGGSRSGDVQ